MSQIWVDEQKVEMHPPSTWNNLTLDQLLDVKSKLLDKIYLARGKQQYLLPLNSALSRIESLISQKLSDPLGLR